MKLPAPHALFDSLRPYRGYDTRVEPLREFTNFDPATFIDQELTLFFGINVTSGPVVTAIRAMENALRFNFRDSVLMRLEE